ncbi:MAG: heme ABC transporter ATP-binding protein [Pseudomonadota bacterium]
MLTATNITVRIGQKTILNRITFAAPPGALTAIVGPNGSGKSTMLRALSGDIACDGAVHLGGDDIRSLKPWQLAARRGVLPQASALAFPFTVHEVVRIGLHSSAGAGTDTRVMQALAEVGLAHYADRFYQELSGGEQQRTQLARVLAQVWEPTRNGVPCWLLLDEPVSALDIAHQLQVMTIARDFAQRGGGVVAVMHDLNLTAMFASEVAVLHKGQVLATGTPDAVLTDDTLRKAYGCKLRVGVVPEAHDLFVLPQSAAP